ncbi:MAG: LUD domain-containing protein [Micromonosporaceae bacterium]|jgi:L-lactate dehydrogenase complex protein LldG|nr:LUD domain-containing protein [Micromonosporaceae bacterium]
MGAREVILDRIRAALGPSPIRVEVPREYRTGGVPDVDLFVDRLVDYRAAVRRCGPNDLAAAVAEALADTRVLAVPPGLPGEWLTAYHGEVVRDGDPRPLSVADLDAPGVTALTGCAVAIAETGTLVLDAGPDQGRRVLTLVPDHHVCVVHAGQIAAGVPDALARLADPTRPLTFVSGPSATSDIELDRVEGVHGPRRLEVIVVEPSGP